MIATDEDVEKMLAQILKRERQRKYSWDKYKKAPRGGIDESSYGEILEYAPAYGDGGAPGAKDWTRGWHGCAEWISGATWASDLLPDEAEFLQRIELAKAADHPFPNKKRVRKGWDKCLEYVEGRIKSGASEELIIHDLDAIIEVHWASKKSKRPNISSTLVRYRRGVKP